MTTSCAENFSKILHQIRIQLVKRNREKSLETEQTSKRPLSLDPIGIGFAAPIDQEHPVPGLPVKPFALPVKEESNELKSFTGEEQIAERLYDSNDDVDSFAAGEILDEDTLVEDVILDAGGIKIKAIGKMKESSKGKVRVRSQKVARRTHIRGKPFALPVKEESDELKSSTGEEQIAEKLYDSNDDIDSFVAGEILDEDTLVEDVILDADGIKIKAIGKMKESSKGKVRVRSQKVVRRTYIRGGQHKCEHCGKIFSRHQNLLRHVKSHLNKREHHCEMCDKRFNTKADLKVHAQIHEETKRFSCEVCGKVFKRSDNMTRHVKIHVNDRAHKCITCGKGFNTRFNLKMHMKMHEGSKARIFACEYCGKSFYRRGSLIEHIRRCLNLKTYKCELCGKGFNNISGLNSHAAVHLASKDFTCELCGKAFKRLLNMKNHMKVHLNEKQYKCEICGKGCNTSSQLSMHKKMHMTGTNYSCEIMR